MIQMESKFALGMKSKAICESCEKIVDITFKLRNVPLGDKLIINDLTVGVCDKCNSVVSIPATQTEKIKAALQ